MSAPYIELHTRSAFSFLQGASLPEEYADVAAKLKEITVDPKTVSGVVSLKGALAPK